MVDFDTESLTLFVNFVAGGGASRTTFPGGTWERVTSRLEGILQEAEPLELHSQVEPGNESLAAWKAFEVKGVFGCDRSG
jgi:hypothetical protein